MRFEFLQRNECNSVQTLNELTEMSVLIELSLHCSNLTESFGGKGLRWDIVQLVVN